MLNWYNIKNFKNSLFQHILLINVLGKIFQTRKKRYPVNFPPPKLDKTMVFLGPYDVTIIFHKLSYNFSQIKTSFPGCGYLWMRPLVFNRGYQ